MKIKKELVLIIIFTIFILGFIYYKYDNNKEYYITDNEYLYDIAKEYLIKKDNDGKIYENDLDNYHLFIKYDGLGITEDNKYKYAYMWILEEAYYLDNDKITNVNSSSVFHKFKFKGDKVVDVIIPKDGSYYTKSVKEMCKDKELQEKVLNYDLKFDLNKEVQEYYKEVNRE